MIISLPAVIVLENLTSSSVETEISAADVLQLSLPVWRLFQLMEEIMAEKENKTIIFVETKKRCDDLTRRMRRDGWEMTQHDVINSRMDYATIWWTEAIQCV